MSICVQSVTVLRTLSVYCGDIGQWIRPYTFAVLTLPVTSSHTSFASTNLLMALLDYCCFNSLVHVSEQVADLQNVKNSDTKAMELPRGSHRFPQLLRQSPQSCPHPPTRRIGVQPDKLQAGLPFMNLEAVQRRAARLH